MPEIDMTFDVSELRHYAGVCMFLRSKPLPWQRHRLPSIQRTEMSETLIFQTLFCVKIIQ